MTQAQTTTDHDLIKKWAEARNGCPATVSATAAGGDPGILRIDFPDGDADEGLEEISWSEFFDKFEERKLAFLYQDKTKDGHISRFFKFVER